MENQRFDNLSLPFEIPVDLPDIKLKKLVAEKINLLITAKHELNKQSKSHYRYYRDRTKDKSFYTWLRWSIVYGKKISKEKNRLVALQTLINKRIKHNKEI